jgi:hypothetical protein
MQNTSWLWPDRVIGKRESRLLREEHNALINKLQDAELALKDTEDANRELLRALKGEQAMRERNASDCSQALDAAAQYVNISHRRSFGWKGNSN